MSKVFVLYAKPLNERLIILLQKKNTLKKTPSSGKSLISTCSFFGGWERKWGGVGVSALLSLTGNRRELVGGGRLFEVGAHARFGAYSIKDGTSTLIFISCIVYYKVL